ncbi:hypothetical protein HHL22_11930 [Hymenobacter sp. RP-2-7]|uniref:Uncharacterized protein n=1 Tax=Hymenobacter polaris TaxID=2682546 RepID=A0A7Y0AF39_9BACT|nr:hypothetical protein [Hymenobacter polaris]NML65915.1 hypothetical protein [Hymenobacter polaris]
MSGLLGDAVVNQLTPPSPDQIQAWGSMVIQFLVAVVTIWATIRKALQKPEAVVKVPVSPPATVTVASCPPEPDAGAGAGAAPLLLLLVLLGWGCASHQRGATGPGPVEAAPELPLARVDSVVVQEPIAGSRVSGRATGRFVVASSARGERIVVGKKATVSVYYGAATVSSSAVAKKGQAATAPGAVLTSVQHPQAAVGLGAGATVQDYRKQGQRGGAAASGAGATATATTAKGSSWWWLLVLAVGGVGYAAWRVCRRKGFFSA